MSDLYVSIVICSVEKRANTVLVSERAVSDRGAPRRSGGAGRFFLCFSLARSLVPLPSGARTESEGEGGRGAQERRRSDRKGNSKHAKRFYDPLELSGQLVRTSSTCCLKLL